MMLDFVMNKALVTFFAHEVYNPKGHKLGTEKGRESLKDKGLLLDQKIEMYYLWTLETLRWPKPAQKKSEVWEGISTGKRKETILWAYFIHMHIKNKGK